MIEALEGIVGTANVDESPAARVTYAVDGTVGYRGSPAVVVFPGTGLEVARVLGLASAEGWKVVGRGGGTSLAAGAVPPEAAIVLSTERLKQGPEISENDLEAVCGAGVTTGELQARAAAAGLFYPPDPSSQGVTMLGGNVATNAGGAHALKYGVTRDYVVELEVALASGEVVRVERGTGSEPLLDLFVGSEGTLGIVTRMKLRLLPAPPTAKTVAAHFAGAKAATEAMVAMLGQGLLPSRLEFMDEVAIRAVQAARDRGLEGVGAVLLAEFDGEEGAVQADVATGRKVMDKMGAQMVKVAETAREEAAMWEPRGAITSSLARLKPGKIGEDICVPRTELPQVVEAIKGLSEETGLEIALFGHAGDGTLHPNIVFDPGDAGEVAAVKAALAGIARIGIEAGGVLSGEHGLGLVKKEFVPLMYDWETIGRMRALKGELDPAGVLNPDLMWPEETDST